MQMIVGIKLGDSSKLYSFDPQGIELHVGDNVIVETVRGVEYAQVGKANTQACAEDMKNPLKPILRKATEDDDKREKENKALEEKAFDICMKKIEKHKLKMKLISAEYTFDRAKVIFNFTADSRVDFRELVKDIAGEMKMRIELRQIYERDDIKLRGAMGMCGRPCCCITYLQKNEKATVKMAKNQNISLNPTKVSGMCGKLMCCLKFENEYYVQTAKTLPKLYSNVKTKDGIGRVSEVDLLGERIKVTTPKDEGMLVSYFKVGEFEVLGGCGGCNQKEATKENDSDIDDNVDALPAEE